MTAQPTLSGRAVGRGGVAATIAMSARARELRAEGYDVISLALGQPDFPTPDNAIEAAHQAALSGHTGYPPVDGTTRLKKAVQSKLLRDNALAYELAEIMITNGGKQAIFNMFMAILDAGDEVVIPSPYWVSYPLIAQQFGAVPVYAPCEEKDGFVLKPGALESAITPRTKCIVLNFPNNPTGAVCAGDDLLALAAVMRRHPQVWILADEIYEHLVFDGQRHQSLAAVAPDLRERILTINGVSKSYAMTGWRVGFAAGPERLMRAMVRIQGNSTSGVSTVGQAAAAAALDGPQDTVRHMRAVYEQRRSLVVEHLRKIPGVTCAMPQGAFYAYPGIGGCIGYRSKSGKNILTDVDFSAAFLEDYHVATVPGSSFGLGPYLRLSCAASEPELREACRRLEAFVKSLH